MHQSLLLTALLGTFVLPVTTMAEDTKPAEEAKPAEAAAPASPWTVTTNFSLVSDYFFRGVSQSWHNPAVQGGIDISHSSGLYAGVWASTISPNTYPDSSMEIDFYGGYNGTISAVDGLGYTVGINSYVYPGGSWKKYNYLGVPNQTPNGGEWDTIEANFGLSYKWFSAKAYVTLTNWFGAEKATGFTSNSAGTTYVEFNANYPLPWWDLTLVGHVGSLFMASRLDLNVPSSQSASMNANPDYVDYKVGISKAFSIAKSEGWTAGLYYVGATNGDSNGYWGKNGFGGSSFNGSAETRNLTGGRLIGTIGRTF